MLIFKKLQSINRSVIKSSSYLNKKVNFNRFQAMSKVDADEANRLIEMGKRNAAYQAIDENVNEKIKVMGIGSGSTIVYAVQRLGIEDFLNFFLLIFYAQVSLKAQKIKNENLEILCIPSSFQSKQLLVEHNLKITDLEAFQNVG